MKIDLKKFRQAHNLFQSDISAILGVNQSNVSRAEIRGVFDLSYEQEKKLFEKFGEKEVKAFCIPPKQSDKYFVVASGNANAREGTPTQKFDVKSLETSINKGVFSDFSFVSLCSFVPLLFRYNVNFHLY